MLEGLYPLERPRADLGVLKGENMNRHKIKPRSKRQVSFM